jgi:cytochrome c oxidase subunit 2
METYSQRPHKTWRGGGSAANVTVRVAESVVACLLVVLLGGCHGSHSPLDPAGPEATHIARLWWIFFSVAAVVWTLVMLGLFSSLRLARAPTPDRRLTQVVATLMGLTIATLFGLLVADVFTNRSLGPPDAANALTIKLTGRQWWWLAEYQDPNPGMMIQVANEIHIPTGRPILFELQSPDVIHSFWIPSLQGKKDLVPGRSSSLWLRADRPGTYQGQCAEFCGFQHAHMGLLIVAEPPEKFAAWQEAQRKTPPAPSTDRQRRGQEVFLTGSCVLCHAIDGTPARSHVGPALTHLASQQSIAANSFTNTRDNIGRWILDPHAMKPGVHMPPNQLSGDDLNALLDYLAILQ